MPVYLQINTTAMVVTAIVVIAVGAGFALGLAWYKQRKDDAEYRRWHNPKNRRW